MRYFPLNRTSLVAAIVLGMMSIQAQAVAGSAADSLFKDVSIQIGQLSMVETQIGQLMRQTDRDFKDVLALRARFERGESPKRISFQLSLIDERIMQCDCMTMGTKAWLTSICDVLCDIEAKAEVIEDGRVLQALDFAKSYLFALQDDAHDLDLHVKSVQKEINQLFRDMHKKTG